MSGCPYITSLDKPCGRTPERLGEDYCDLHGVLAQFDEIDFSTNDHTTISVPKSLLPLVGRIASDIRVNLDVRPWTPPTVPYLGLLAGLHRQPPEENRS